MCRSRTVWNPANFGEARQSSSFTLRPLFSHKVLLCSWHIELRITWWESPLCKTLFLAISHRSQVLSFHSWAAMAYSSIKASYREDLWGNVSRNTVALLCTFSDQMANVFHFQSGRVRFHSYIITEIIVHQSSGNDYVWTGVNQTSVYVLRVFSCWGK